MGDMASAQVPDVGALEQDTAKIVNTTTSGGPMPPQDESRTIQGHKFSPQTQEHPTVSQHAFSAQFDMSQPLSGPRPGPYNMAPMANALPTMGFRPGQYPQNTHQRMNPAGSPPMMQHMSQFPGHPPLQVAGQSYYLQPQVAPYYGNQMQQAQAANMMSQRQSMAFYPNQMMMGSQQSAYYYPPGPQYQPAAHPVPNGAVSGHHAGGGSTTGDPRAMAQTADFGGIHPQGLKQGQGRTGKQSPNKSELKQTSDGTERRKSAVRGPPRKPRQSGKLTYLDDRHVG
jgi:hypothetical protein